MKLESAGYVVMTAVNGQEGIEKARTRKPDLILLDMQMPGLSGAETLQMLKADPDSKDIKVLFLSSLGNPDERSKEINDQASKELGALGYLRKTDDLDSLVSHVHQTLAA